MKTSEPLAVLLVAHHTINSLLSLNSQHLTLSTATIIKSLFLLDELSKLYPQLRVIEPNAGERMLIASWWIVGDSDQKRLLEESMLVTSVFQEVKGGISVLLRPSKLFKTKSTVLRVAPSRNQSVTSSGHAIIPPLSPCRSIKKTSPPNFCRPLPKIANSNERRQQNPAVNLIAEEELFHAL
ncbi:hypothetical protein [Phaffia rhodozyma]|uniref:Uncharacterized protein n=1 Tax=Phaffia rhodozyma TaxID=264483 RepID=A0A0F7SJI8_PHARH|nr:hypothetical protein [Phaffia rhodozyma]